MRKELVFNNGHNSYTEDKRYFQKDKKKPINIHEADTKKIVLSNKTPYGKKDGNKCHIAYLSGGFRPLHIIIIKNIKMYTDRMNVLAGDNELLKYIEIWNKIEPLFHKKINEKGFYSKPLYNNEYLRTKLSLYNENFWSNKALTKDKYYGHSDILFLK